MINTKIYKSIYVLAEKLLEADSKNDQKTFDALYAQLKELCIENEKSDKDHPEQWETLADFTEDLDEALDRKSTRLNSSHVKISYAVFCLKKKRTSTE